MENNNKEAWSKVYQENRTRWDVGYAAPPIAEYFEQVENKEARILIPGAGNAYEAEHLFKLGFKNVFALDWAREPFDNLKNRFPDFPDSNLLQGDFFKHEGNYDFVVEHVFFCAIEPELRQDYAKKVHALLVDGGRFTGLLINDSHPQKENENGPPYGGTKTEYERYFLPYFNMKIYEDAKNSIKPRQGRELFCVFVKK